jgi:hypothetical protein
MWSDGGGSENAAGRACAAGLRAAKLASIPVAKASLECFRPASSSRRRSLATSSTFQRLSKRAWRPARGPFMSRDSATATESRVHTIATSTRDAAEGPLVLQSSRKQAVEGVSHGGEAGGAICKDGFHKLVEAKSFLSCGRGWWRFMAEVEGARGGEGGCWWKKLWLWLGRSGYKISLAGGGPKASTTYAQRGACISRDQRSSILLSFPRRSFWVESSA